MTSQSLQRRALSEVLPEGGRSGRRREEARQVEFVRVGQALKLDTIVKGDAPTSLANTGLFRRSVSCSLNNNTSYAACQKLGNCMFSTRFYVI